MTQQGYICWECEFHVDGICELKQERVSARQLACRNFELG